MLADNSAYLADNSDIGLIYGQLSGAREAIYYLF